MLHADYLASVENSLADDGRPLPEWLPDETLFSLLSRYHRLTGNRLASDTCRTLFGRHRQGCQHDFPSHLDELIRGTHCAIGDAEGLIRQRTILPFYLPFKTKVIANEALTALRNGTADSIKYRLGILTSRFRANHPLKACPTCMDADRGRFGTAYWHLSHQYPGVWLCPAHRTPLLQATIKSTGVERFLWHLPDLSLLVETVPPDLSVENQAGLSRFAALALGLAGLPAGFHFDPLRLASTYRQAMIARGLATPSGRAKLADASLAYTQSISGLRVVPELAALPGTSSLASSLISRMLGRPAAFTHPLRQLSVVYWLFQDWSDFVRAYAATADMAAVSLSAAARSPKDGQHASKAQLLACLDGGDSLRRAAGVVGVDYQTAATWATDAGYSVQRRAKKLKPDRLASLKHDLRSGMPKSEAAARHGISVESVTRILFTEIGLHGEWEQARRERAQDAARKSWQDAIQIMAGAGVKLVRAYAPAAYAWLYRNDRAWLSEQCKNLPRPPRTGGQQVDWDARDTVLAQQVRQVALALTTAQVKQALRLSQLYQAIPELKAKLGKLDRLPLTALAIVEVLHRK
ncbi:TnsD family Tn7-like transposition protein [Chitinimonas sp.]|uniref:TnsD family Tn7-like transposition protein n=1 Tax=Chitinimonas sp. TaxID=1934313 RepID=UPI0035B20741